MIKSPTLLARVLALFWSSGSWLASVAARKLGSGGPGFFAFAGLGFRVAVKGLKGFGFRVPGSSGLHSVWLLVGAIRAPIGLLDWVLVRGFNLSYQRNHIIYYRSLSKNPVEAPGQFLKH